MEKLFKYLMELRSVHYFVTKSLIILLINSPFLSCKEQKSNELNFFETFTNWTSFNLIEKL